MAKVYGKPSSYLRKKDFHYAIKACLTWLGGVSIALILVQALSLYSNKLIGLLVTLTLVSFLSILIYKFYKEDQKISDKFFQGREGESIILKELKKLPDTFRIFFDVKIQKLSNIDLVVVGPTGIFTVEVKSHKGIVEYKNEKLSVNGFSPGKDFLKQAKSESKSLHEFLKKNGVEIWVKPILVFSGKAIMHFGLNPVDRVFVVQKDFLLKVILDTQKETLSEDKVLEIEETLKLLVSE
ncbi:MAG: nuclease-related domain-containing protein [Minisyncoccota bacterium]